jgi:hypothetical protein
MTRWRDERGDVVAQYRVDMASKCAVDGQSLQVDAIKHQVEFGMMAATVAVAAKWIAGLRR